MEQQSLLGTLGLDWKLFLAQLVNFGIVLFIFWKWVVKPLGATLIKRQERIEQGLKNADRMDDEKKKFDEWKQAEMKKVRTEADHVLRTTTDTANQIKQDTIVDAQKQAAKVTEQAKASMESEKSQMLKEAKQEIATLVVAATEKILRGKLDPKKDQELIAESVRNIK
ncbi:MAG: ATP synthase F0 subunit B [Candidatus Doudnabacteria bacterium RIFCSPLOWO2_02_FULL_49_13]|uniref:ATP synthase subunit b n=1 Tax=Candidatus Doudnabacteria bacterium RIFCSPHIGHO2_12_FULL_48_16 TaxID=1817838 RepID=A0A1F5PLQ2_9BACT|nr:MAG: ATP synthase F0 subunit B [Candidatus Doudnabacteria bacterium RIFCSPHIGHO2_02_FULL_49_24]OGE89468.1 MAG: ATP synthase F0 subunit B [Candidatus Doudnabacteria bacterium RIFCSPHIGHO2_01_FULL_50_67]OGE90863.1 MAG: ATP synthase F0 subunit B [Candidatus Doudnabacteria bacterium RIFCSPHIGHO2_12_FULL_48_16]OGE97574.1 MAG: ATP synthase F0 subunit B [Candidatus Doudnabacteria bacterium RIFCSPLOWO2_01_FULL_49_40]OGF02738.1 MAG: ATP synthase F0 subunit B [Candidatus Doudnabacteria bacterium RIFCS